MLSPSLRKICWSVHSLKVFVTLMHINNWDDMINIIFSHTQTWSVQNDVYGGIVANYIIVMLVTRCIQMYNIRIRIFDKRSTPHRDICNYLDTSQQLFNFELYIDVIFTQNTFCKLGFRSWV